VRVDAYWASLQPSPGTAAVAPSASAAAAAPARGSRLTSVLTWIVVAALALAALGSIGLRVVGIQPLAVLSGSMQPTIMVGDLVLVQPIAATEARVGDIVTFDAPDREGITITHRVTEVTDAGTQLDFVTKGDANSAGERWSIERTGTVGKHLLTIPKAGRASALIGSPQLRALTLGLATIIALGSLMWWIWRPEQPKT
jgi:signal peptidase I